MKDFFTYFTPITYWILTIIWIYILFFYLNKLKYKLKQNKMLKLLLVILSIDAFRTLFESMYFGAWYTSLSGLLPIQIFDFLAQPQYVFFPKIINLVAALSILILLIKKWLPAEILQKNRFENLVEEQKKELVKTNKELADAVNALKESEYLYKETQRIGKMGGWSYNVASKHVIITDTLYEIYGKKISTLEEGIHYYHPDDREIVYNAFNEVITQQKSYDLEVRFINAQGDKLFVRTLGQPVIKKGKVVKIFGNMIDITKHKQAEEKSKLNRILLRNVLDIVPSFICAKNLDGKYVLVNTKLSNFYGLTVEAMTNVLHADLCEDANELRTMLAAEREVIESGNPTFIPEETMKNPDGSIVVLETYMIPFTAQGDPAILIVSNDITERKRGEKERERLQNELQQAQKMESVGRLAGGVAHDYNNISSIILGYSELALTKVDQSDPLYHYLMEIRTAVNRSADVTRQLLAFARKQTVAPKVLDLNDTIGDLLKMLRRLIGEDIDIAWIPGAEIRPINIDPTQINQIMANLCVNARDAIANVGRVTVETKNIKFDEDDCTDNKELVPGEYVQLSVSDDGSGMTPETRDKIFEPFFTTKGIGKGTGLGLAMVYGIVRQNNGFINVYSELEKGTTFRIYLPIYEGEIAKAESEKNIELPLSRGETVLLVEDEDSILKMITKILEEYGYAVLFASNPMDAVKLATEHADKISLLITDLVMPAMNGRELSERLKSLYPNLKTLFMSGYTADIIEHRGVLERGVNFIAKPFSNNDLAHKIREVLDEVKG